MDNLKGRTLRGGLAKVCGQGANFALRFAYLMILARLLTPEDFGLVAMVTVVTGVFELFTSAGLSSAMVQQATITNQQISKLFWVNLLVGALLALLCVATAPLLVRFFHEPRLLWVTIAMAPAFLFGAAGVQHMAILQRQLRYVTITVIEIVALLSSIAVGIGMALAGFGYWAIVGAAVTVQAVSTICAVAVTRWIPGRFDASTSIGSMLRYGGTVTLSGVVVYIAYNLDKVLLGRVWGVEALGVYGRAYQLINIPISNLNVAVGGVAFSALSRLQDDPVRFKAYFLKGYSLVVSMTIPVTIFCGVFADEIVTVVLGRQWSEAAPIFRLMSPTILIFAMINPLSWVLFSVGLQRRSLKISLTMTPLLVVAYLIGLPYGANGVAAAYSAVMALWLVPHIAWCLHGTSISLKELFSAISRPLLSGLIAAGAVIGIGLYVNDAYALSPLMRLCLGGGAMAVIYAVVLLFILRQKDLYLDVLRGLKQPSSANTYGSLL